MCRVRGGSTGYPPRRRLCASPERRCGKLGRLRPERWPARVVARAPPPRRRPLASRRPPRPCRRGWLPSWWETVAEGGGVHRRANRARTAKLSPRISMEEVAPSREHESHAGGITGGDDSLVVARATRLDDGGHAGRRQCLGTVREREEGVAGGDRPLRPVAR